MNTAPWYQLGLVPSEIARLCAHVFFRGSHDSYDTSHTHQKVEGLNYAQLIRKIDFLPPTIWLRPRRKRTHQFENPHSLDCLYESQTSTCAEKILFHFHPRSHLPTQSAARAKLKNLKNCFENHILDKRRFIFSKRVMNTVLDLCP